MAYTVTDTAPRVKYTATASQTAFTIPFEFPSDATIKAYNNGTALTYSATPADETEFSLSGEATTGGGTMTLGGTGATLNDEILIIRDIPVERSSDFPSSGIFDTEALNSQLDELTVMVQQQEQKLDKRTLRLSVTDDPEEMSSLPDKATRANKLLSFDADGNPSVDNSAADSATAAAASAAAAAASEASASSDASATAADAISTAADAVSTAADAVSTGNDASSTAADAISTAADAASTAADAISTAADAAATASDATNTGVDATATGADAVNTAADAVSTAADAAAASASAAAAAASAASIGTEFADDAFRVQDDADATKQIAFQASGITTGTTRTITMPDEDIDLGNIGSSSSILKTANYTAAAGEVIGADTNAVGTWTLTLPAFPTAGDRVTVFDAGGAWDTANLTLGRNGETIDGDNVDMTCDVAGGAFIMDYNNSDWQVIPLAGQVAASYLELAGGTMTGDIEANADGTLDIGKTATRFANVWSDALNGIDPSTFITSAPGAPAGSLIYHAANAAPTGYLKCNGATVSRTTYADLYAEIGDTFGNGDGSTTFEVPDFRGEFLRGWADDGSVDSGRAFGSYQADEMESHTHSYSQRQQGVAVSTQASGATGSGSLSGKTTGAAGSGSENRPRNYAVLACIKY